MMHIEQAIREAVEKGGYKLPNYYYHVEIGDYTDLFVHQIVWCDPAFWQALGKARGWICTLKHAHQKRYNCAEWLRKWKALIDYLADGKDAESFFQELLH